MLHGMKTLAILLLLLIPAAAVYAADSPAPYELPIDIPSAPPPYQDDGPIQPIEPIPPVGADPAKCEMIQHCDGSGNCHWIQECH